MNALKPLRLGAGVAAALLLFNCKPQMKRSELNYPDTRMDSTVDNYHGTLVPDPYRWLEDDNSPETARWVKAENQVTQDYLSKIPYRENIKKRLTELWNYPKYGVPTKVGEYYFFFENDGLQNQSVLYRQKGLDGKPEVFLNPNDLSADGTAALVTVDFSQDDKYMSYAVAESGSDWVRIHVMDVGTKQLLADQIKWVKFSGATWSGNGFYYSRYDEPQKGSELSAQNRYQKIFYHKLGTEQSADKLIFEDMEHPLRYFSAAVSKDNKQLFITSTEGTSGTEILYKDLKLPGAKFEVLFKGFDYDYSLVWAKDDKAVFYTNDSAPNYRLVEVDFPTAAASSSVASRPVVKSFIPEKARLMEGAVKSGNTFVVYYLDKARSRVEQYSVSGNLIRDVELPGIGTVGGFGAEEDEDVAFYAFTSFTAPTSVYKYDIQSGRSELYKQAEVSYDPDDFIAEQATFLSKDKTPVTMFVVHRRDMKLNGRNPLYLYGYGGFNISLTPTFSPQNILFMEQGGIYAMVNLRGGGEYGEDWHKAGMLDKKQNVFDDFISAAEYLISKNYTSSDRLAIAGGSNGGLLVGACMTQRPDLFAVALPAVGVMDMLRYHKFTVGWGWAVEYGSSDNAEQLEYLYKYSPLHNIRKGTCYPATLITTADHDDRVVPAHSFKFAAALQAAQACDNPMLIRIDSNAGHGAGKPTSKKIDEVTDVLSFTFWNMGTKVDF